MIYTLYFTFTKDFYSDMIDDVIDYEYYVEPNFQDILEYEYETMFRKKYNPLNWFLDDGAKSLVNDIETKWLKNQIDTSSLYTNYLFKDWLKDKYYTVALNKAYLNSLNNYDLFCIEHDAVERK